MRVVPTGAQQRSGLVSFVGHVGLPLLFLIATCLFTGLFFGFYCSSNAAHNSYTNDFSCAPDGSVIFPGVGTSNIYWNPSLFLSITLATGHLTFPQAKAIDICWDLVVGRGGQMFLSIAAYPLIRRSLLTLLEKKPLRMPVVISLTFEHFTFWSWWAVAKDLTYSWSWRLFAYLYITLYLLAFGTIVSAMTGYQANMAPFYRDQGNLMDYANVRSFQAANITDAHRVGLEDGVLVWSDKSDPNYPLYNYTDLSDNRCDSYTPTIYTKAGNRTHGTFFSNDTNTDASDSGNEHSDLFSIDWVVNDSFTSQYRHEPTIPSSLRTKGYAFVDCTTSNITLSNHTHRLDAPPLTSFPGQAVYLDESGKVLNTTALLQNKTSTCQTLDSYRWGFSSLLLFSFCIATIIYLSTLLTLNIDIWLNSQVNRMPQCFSLYRDILDHANEVKAEVGEKAEHISARELDSKIKTLSAEVSVSAYEYPPSRAQVFSRNHRPRFQRLTDELRAGHVYSMGETKRALGLSYGPVYKHTAKSDFEESVQAYDMT